MPTGQVLHLTKLLVIIPPFTAIMAITGDITAICQNVQKSK